jgi:hypothetical protein
MSSALSGLGPFHLLEILGEGIRSTVYRARKEGDDHEFALKILHIPVASDEFECRAFKERSQVAMPMQGANVAPITEMGVIDERPYITMPLLDGLSLDQLPRRRDVFKLNPKQATHLLHQILQGLDQAIEADPPIIHSRLNEGSFMIGLDGTVSILGFGSHGSSQTDLRPLAELAQRFTNRWPVEIDSFLDALQAPEGFSSIGEALKAFPTTDEGADAAGLGRTIKRRIRALSAEQDEPAAASAKEPAKEPAKDKAKDKAKKSPSQTKGSALPTEAEPSTFAVSYEARWLALACGGVVLLAFVIELFSVPL